MRSRPRPPSALNAFQVQREGAEGAWSSALMQWVLSRCSVHVLVYQRIGAVGAGAARRCSWCSLRYSAQVQWGLIFTASRWRGGATHKATRDELAGGGGGRYANSGTGCACRWRGYSTLEAARGALAGGKRVLCMKRHGVCQQVAWGATHEAAQGTGRWQGGRDT